MLQALATQASFRMGLARTLSRQGPPSDRYLTARYSGPQDSPRDYHEHDVLVGSPVPGYLAGCTLQNAAARLA